MLLELAWVMVDRHEHDILRERIGALGLLAGFRFVDRFFVEDAFYHFDFLNRDALSWIDDPDQRQLRVRVLEVNRV